MIARLCFLLLCLFAGVTFAETVRIPLVQSGAGTQIPSTVNVRLVNAQKRGVTGFWNNQQVAEYSNQSVTDSDLIVTLAPQAEIATQSGEATYYLIVTTVAGVRTEYLVQVAVSGVQQELEALVGAATIDPADITAGLTIPIGGETGQALAKDSATNYDVSWQTLSGTAADIDQYDIAGKLTAGSGPYVGIAAGDLTEEASPASLDFLLGWLADGTLVKYDIGNLPGGSGSVDTSGTPVANDFARFTDADTIEGRSYAEVKADLSLEIGTDVLAQQAIGIVDDNLLEVDGSPNAAEYARFTANGIEGRIESEFKVDFNLEDADINTLAAAQVNATNVGAVNAAASSKVTPVDADSVPIVDSEAADVIKRVTFTNLKAFLKTYNDTLYADVLGADDNYVTDAEKIVVGNTSGTNTGDEVSASPTASGVAELATISEIDTGTDTGRTITPAGLAGSALQSKVNGIEAGADVTDPGNVASAGAHMSGGTDVPITDGGTGQSTAQAAIDALSAVAAATNEHVLTKDTGTGNAIWKASAGGGGAPEGTAVLSTGEVGGTKFLREDGDGTSSWQVVAGSGDVVKVGTPVDGQIGVWTGNGTIEGDPALTFDTTTDDLEVAASGKFSFGAVDILSDSAGTTTLSNIDAIDETTETAIELVIDSLSNLTVVGTIATGTWQGTAIADAYIPNDITIDLATTATTANAGDSATAFFSAGTIEHERGGLETNVSAYAGLVKISAGATSAVTDLAGLNTALGSSIADGAHTADTNANTICTGTGNYLDGEGNCDALVTFPGFSATINSDYGNDSIIPDDILSTGQTDEYCLTYELTGDTFAWQACSGSAEVNNLESDGAVGIVDTEIFIGTGAGTGNYAAVSGDATLANTGALTIASDVIEESMLKAVDAASDEECLTYEVTTGDFEWQSCGAGGGDFSGPASATDNAIVRFDGTGGKTGQNSGVTINDSNSVTLAGDIVMTEKADHTETPAAGSGYLWTKSTTPSTLIFTNDAGTDTTLGSGGSSTERLIWRITNDVSPITVSTDDLACFYVSAAFTLTGVYGSLNGVGGTSGTTTIDINENGISVLSTLLTIDYGESTSATAATAAVISDSAIAANSQLCVEIDVVTGDADETGLVVILTGSY